MGRTLLARSEEAKGEDSANYDSYGESEHVVDSEIELRSIRMKYRNTQRP